MIYTASVDKQAGRPCCACAQLAVGAIRCRSYSTALIERERFAVSANFLISSVLGREGGTRQTTSCGARFIPQLRPLSYLAPSSTTRIRR